jgi:hypothetical protein
MKNLILSLALLFALADAFAQSATATTPAQEATAKMTQLYGLDASQQAEMLKIQERKYRNLAEVEPLKTSAPSDYILKIRAIQLGNSASFERILTEGQMETFRKEQKSLREKKAIAYKELKTAGASQQEIDKKMMECDLEAM